MSAQPHHKLTPEEYLELDRAAEVRSEYYRGEMFEMPASTRRHAGLVSRTLAALYPIAHPLGCEVCIVDLRLLVSPGEMYAYPDLMVLRVGPDDDDLADIVDNPILIAEVLSEATEVRDRGFKLTQYRTIESLQEYVLISQLEPHVEVYRRRTDSYWLYTYYQGTDASCRLESLDCEVPLASIYQGVQFGDASTEPTRLRWPIRKCPG